MKKVKRFVHLKEENDAKIVEVSESLGLTYSGAMNYVLKKIEFKETV